MLYSSAPQKRESRTSGHLTSKRSMGAFCLGLASIFLAGIFTSGCVVHQHGHGRGYAHGHHKAKIKIVPEAEIRVGPKIVIHD